MSNWGESFHQLTASIVSQLTALLQLKYQSHTPFTTFPTTMLVAASSITLYYLLHLEHLRSPMSPFASIAKHLMVCSAYAAVSTLAAALFPDSSSPLMYTIFGLLSAGQVLYVLLRDKLSIEDGEEEGEASKFEVCTRKACRFLKKICSSVAKFFSPPPTLPI